jgi:hypothetical protein
MTIIGIRSDGVVENRPVKIVCENTLDASSSSLENVNEAFTVSPCDSCFPSLAAMAF